MVNKLKDIAVKTAIKYIKDNSIIGIGSGTTISHFIDILFAKKKNIKGLVSASKISTNKLKKYNFNIYKVNKIEKIGIYFDSADEINYKMQMIKGGGAALTNEKIISSIADIFICIIDESKYVKNLGLHPVPIEIIPLAKKFIIKKLLYIGAIAKPRINTITEHGNIILDVYKLNLYNPIKIEKYINNIPGVITVGLFTQRCADIVIIGKSNNTVSVIHKKS
ncbi:ribose-5-phosphate isomerase RpiA [Enterobacteriaceae endosymbiont of Donacia thalassina]|uniref:ribose-5-phosphate isomerase RpiA n=1 Tax=Enterobacteriaceae endosymbiont of Donacia thalassina TaxID=2675786 RepID=UPI001449BD70|nr:ribose-5-phosphate isomerase RpiA [Enterobacteriaceae endosymbiont of Donacia thalassina]QJC37311.1 ribose-5-phosphate isomerase RpiA [Enterobacteriaceae endosymbiont of Donacia thalassina]